MRATLLAIFAFTSATNLALAEPDLTQVGRSIAALTVEIDGVQIRAQSYIARAPQGFERDCTVALIGLSNKMQTLLIGQGNSIRTLAAETNVTDATKLESGRAIVESIRKVLAASIRVSDVTIANCDPDTAGVVAIDMRAAYRKIDLKLAEIEADVKAGH